VRTTTPVKAATLAFVIVVSFGLAYYGHATIVRFQELATWALGIGAGLLLLFALGRVDWSYTPQQGLHGFAGLATWFVALGVIVSGAISWCTVPADYTRYLPRSTRSGSIVLWTTVGCFLPATLLCTIAVLAGTRVDMSDPLSAIKEIVPAWFYIPVVAVLLLGSMTNNVLTIYSSSMSLQTLGLKIKRYQAVLIDGVIGTAMAFYATFVTDFLTALTEFLQLALVWYAPYTAIFIVDIVLRRNRYDGVQLHAREGGIYWSRNGFHVPGVVALLAGMASGLLFSTTARFQGPLSTALSNIDLSYIVSAVVGGAVYAVLQRRALATSRLKTTSLIPGQAAVPLVTDAVVADPVADPNGA
jgi:purine-cytosine permease-like protein